MSGMEHDDIGTPWASDMPSSYPEDFSLDEELFAGEMNALFGVAREDLPPLYIETLLESERVSHVMPGFEQKLTYQVFRRLELERRPLIEARRGLPSWRDLLDTPRQMARPLVVSLSALLVCMVLTMGLASPAFGAGLRILLGQTGVEQSNGYPLHVHTPTARDHRGILGNQGAFEPVTTPVFWLGATNGNYAYQGTQLLDPSGKWSKGPVVDLQYSLLTPSAGSGIVDIREFQVSSQYAAVLQVVQAGSATSTQVGALPAIYVDGVWIPVSKRDQNTMNGMMTPAAAPSYTWESDIQSELIFERDGVVFWMVADQRDGIGQAELTKLAQVLTPTTYTVLQSQRPWGLREVGETMLQSLQSPHGREVYHLVPKGASRESNSGVLVASEP